MIKKRHRTNYTMVCRTCGAVFESAHPAVNCNECRGSGRAIAAVKSITRMGVPITAELIDKAAKEFGCSKGGMYAVLRKSGYKSMSIWLKDWKAKELIEAPAASSPAAWQCKEAIASFEMLRALLLLDPSNGKALSVDSLSQDNQELYYSAGVAIDVLRRQIVDDVMPDK